MTNLNPTGSNSAGAIIYSTLKYNNTSTHKTQQTMHACQRCWPFDLVRTASFDSIDISYHRPTCGADGGELEEECETGAKRNEGNADGGGGLLIFDGETTS